MLIKTQSHTVTLTVDFKEFEQAFTTKENFKNFIRKINTALGFELLPEVFEDANRTD